MVISEAALDVGGVEFVAVCDVDTEHLNNSASRLDELQGSRPQTFADYRDLLEVDGLEAVFIASTTTNGPEHVFVLIFAGRYE